MSQRSLCPTSNPLHKNVMQLLISKWTKAEADELAEKVMAMDTKDEIVAALKAAAKE